MLDDGFVRRVYKTTAVVLAIAVIWSLGFQKYLLAAGLVAGALVGMATLWSLDWVVRRTIVPGAAGGGKALAKYTFLKYPLLAAVLIPVVLSRNLTFILAFLGGMILTHVVIFLKAVGIMINERMKA